MALTENELADRERALKRKEKAIKGTIMAFVKLECLLAAAGLLIWLFLYLRDHIYCNIHWIK